MKYAAILMTLIFLLSLAGAGYLYLTANVTVSSTGIAVSEALSQPQAFGEIRQALQEGSATGTVFTDSIPERAEDYKFVTFRIQLKNTTFIDAEMVELQVVPRDGDVLQLAGGKPVTLTAQGSGVYEATILTSVNSFTGHEVIVTYYLWGQPFSMRAACSN